MALSERLNTPISNAELERRWRAVRAAMEREKIDVLLMQNNNDHMGGYVRYFTDMPATNGYPNTVVFPRDDEMTVVCQGPFGGGRSTDQSGWPTSQPNPAMESGATEDAVAGEPGQDQTDLTGAGTGGATEQSERQPHREGAHPGTKPQG